MWHCEYHPLLNCCSKTNLSKLLTKPLFLQIFQQLVRHEQFPLQLQDEGELNSETVNGKSMTQTKHRRLIMMYPKSDRDIVEVLTD